MTSLRKEIETWTQAIKAYEAEEYNTALDLFGRIGESGKIQTNMGIIYATLGEHEAAVDHFTKASQLDQWLGIAYFQCGVSNFLLGIYDLAMKNFEEAAVTLRENSFIDYHQLGLDYRLELAEVLFNKGLCMVYLGSGEEGIRVMQEAYKFKANPEHEVIAEAIQDGGDGYTVFSISVGILYKPPAQKAANTTPKDYLGKTIMVVGDTAQEAYSEFAASAAERARNGNGAATPTKRVDRPPTNIDGAPPALASRMPNANTNKNGSGGWVIGSDVKANNGIIVPQQQKSGSVADSAPKLGAGGVSRYGTISRDGAAGGGGLSRAASLAPPTPQQGPSRGMTISRSPSALSGAGVGRRPSASPAPGTRLAPAPGMPADMYDVLDDYGGEEEVMPLRRGSAGGGLAVPQPMRALSTRSASTNGSGGSRGIQRQRTMGSVRAMSIYGEEDEVPLRIIKVKIHGNGNVRGMAMPPDVPMDEFFELVATKFSMQVGDVHMKFADEDGTKVSLLDESDYDLAIATARENANGKPEGKLSVWVE